MIAIMSAAFLSLLDRLRPRKRHWRDGAVLFQRGDRVREMHLVTSGTVNLMRSQADGSTLVLQRAGPGSILAEASLHSDAYHCDAMASGDAVTSSYSKGSLKKLLFETAANGELWAGYLAHELQKSRLRSEILSLKTVSQRLDAWIELSGEWPIPKGTWKFVAYELGVTPEAFYRELAARRAAQRMRLARSLRAT